MTGIAQSPTVGYFKLGVVAGNSIAVDGRWAAVFLASDQAKARLSRYVIRRFGKPDDVAHMALFLCSNAASWITGQTYPVNGGYSFAQ